MDNAFSPPIGLFAYNRPQHLKWSLEALDRSQKFFGKTLPLKIFCDVPRKKEHEQGCREVVECAKRWPGAEVIVREKNYGFRNITEGITQLCEAYGSAIVIEDDVLVSPDFLPYMCLALEKYVEDPRLFMVSGFMYHDAQPLDPKMLFLSQAFIWGWGTWKRAWDHFQWDLTGWEKQKKNKAFIRHFDVHGSYKFFRLFERVMRGEVEAWDSRWSYTLVKQGGLTMYPSRSLTWNCGSGGGVHGNNSHLDANPALGKRETYIHGTLNYDDFHSPRLFSNLSEIESAFPKQVSLNRKALWLLSITFLKQRREKEPKKRFRRLVQIWWRMFLAKLTFSGATK